MRLTRPLRQILTDKFMALRPEYVAAKHPIVLCHGLSGFDSLTMPFPRMAKSTKRAVKQSLISLDYWYGIKDELERVGNRVFIARVPPFGTIEDRANHLNDFITNNIAEKAHRTENTPKHEDVRVNLVSHSMGGLDGRFLISQLENKRYEVASLTTVSTPHRGSEMADVVAEYGGIAVPEVIRQLTTKNMEAFNEKVVDDPNTAYFSYGARMHPHWYNVFTPTYKVMKHRLVRDGKPVDNDGLVSVESAMWGEYLGTLDNVDHLDLINWTNKVRTAVDLVMFAQKPKFNPVALYLDIAESLSMRGL